MIRWCAVLALAAAVTGCELFGPFNNPNDPLGAAYAGDLYPLSYSPNGATSGVPPQGEFTYRSGLPVTLQTNIGGLIRGTQFFSHWNTSGDGSGYSYAAGASAQLPEGTSTLYAQYKTAFVYVASASANTVTGLAIDASSGAVSDTPGSPYPSGTDPFDLKVSPNGKVVYEADLNGSTVTAFSVDSSGALSPVPGSPFAAGTGPAGLAVAPSGLFLYAANLVSNTIQTYSVGAAGALTALGAPLTSTSPEGLALTPDGKHLYAGFSTGTGVPAFSVNTVTGSLAPLVGSPFVPGSGVNPNHPVVSPNGKFLFVPSRFSNDVGAFALNAGVPSPVAGSPFPAGNAPTAAAITPDGLQLFVSNGGDMSLSVYAVTAGVLTPAATVGLPSYPLGLALSPEGRYLYIALSGSNLLAAYKVGPGGALNPVPGQPFTAGASPRAVAITP